MTREALEVWALRLLGNGAGTWTIRGNRFADKAIVGWPLESMDEPIVVFQMDGRLKATVVFKVVPATPEGSSTDVTPDFTEF